MTVTNDRPFRRVFTPDRIRRIQFSKSPLGRRGVDPAEVELFQRRLAEELAAAETENARQRAESERLRAEVDRLRDWYRNNGERVEPGAAVPVQVDVQAVNLLSEAQLQAEAYIAQAEAHCRRVTVEARRQAAAILTDAQKRADMASQEAAHAYRERAGDGYAADLEEMERRMAWLQAFCHAVQVQLKAASDAFSGEIEKLTRVPDNSRKGQYDQHL